MSETYLVTGALGCIGAWVVKQLVERGDRPVVFDLGDDPRRLRDVMAEDALSRVELVQGDLTDADAVRRCVESSGARRILHLAGLQVPFCKADPALGARVNVLGTIHVFEAAKQAEVERVVYASSAAVYGPSESNEAPGEGAICEPQTHYGVFKHACEGCARMYFQDEGISSVGLRPLTVYGVGRDQGLTSGPTRAMKAAVARVPFRIPFAGATDFHYVADTAAAFIACADRAPAGAHVFNLHGETARVGDVVEIIERIVPEARGTITFEGAPLPIPPVLDGSAIRHAIEGLPRTPLEDGIRATIDRFRALREAGRLDTRDLE